MSEKINFISYQTVLLDGFEREGGGVLKHMFIYMYMSKTKILYIKFLLHFAGLCYLLFGEGGGSKRGATNVTPFCFGDALK